jgi:hypothetical protein
LPQGSFGYAWRLVRRFLTHEALTLRASLMACCTCESDACRQMAAGRKNRKVALIDYTHRMIEEAEG